MSQVNSLIDMEPRVANHPEPNSDPQIVSRLAQQDKIPWYQKPNLRLLYLLMFPACIGAEVMNGYVASLVNSLQAVPSWLKYYNNPHSVSLGLMASMAPLGSLVAVPFAPFVVDNFGRRCPILLGGVVSVAGSILQGSALNFTMFVVTRFILGFANIFCVVAASTLIGELSHPKERPFIGGIYATSFYTGAIAAAAATLTTFSMQSSWGWRIPCFLQMIPGLCQVCFVCFIPESPRWLISIGRGSEALDILIKYHAEGDESSEFAQVEYTQIEDTLQRGSKIARISWMSMFSMPGMRKRIIITTFLGLAGRWSGGSLISGFLPLILESIGIHNNLTKNIVNITYVSWKAMTGTLVVLIAAQYPRRTMYLACTISLFTVLVAFTIANADYSITDSKFSAGVVFVLIFLFGPAYTLAFGSANYTYLIELFPFHARATGMTMYQWWTECGSFSAQFANPIGIDILGICSGERAGWRWYIACCMWIAFSIAFVYAMFPETSGRTLEELAFLFEEGREILEDGVGQVLQEHGGVGTYGTMEAGR